MMAHTGITLNTSENVFQSLMLYFLLPEWGYHYIHHRIRRCDWCWSIRGCRGAWRNSMGFWSCMPALGRWFRWIAFLDRHNPPGRDSWSLLEILRIRIAWSDRGIARGCLLPYWRITADLDGRLQLEQHRLLEEDLSRLYADASDLRLQQLHVLPPVL